MSAAGQGEEDVVEVWWLGREALHGDPVVLKPVEHLPDTSDASVARKFERQVVLTPLGAVELQNRSGERIIFSEVEPDAPARCPLLQLGRRAFCDQGTTVDEGYSICEAICFFQILRRQQDGHPIGDQVSDDPPEHLAPTWIEASRWLVEEDNPGLTHEGHRKIEAAAHPA